MAIKHFDGFNWAYNGAVTDAAGGIDSWFTSGGREGTRCLDASILSSSDDGVLTYPMASTVPQDSTVVIGMAFKRVVGDIGVDILRLNNSDGNSVVTVEYTASDSIGVEIGGTPYGSVLTSSSIFDYFEFVIDMDASAGSIEIFKNGVSEYSTSAIATRENTGAIAQVQWFRDVNDSEWFVDDFYVLDDTGTINTSRLGDVHVMSLTPSSAGTDQDGVGSDGDSTDNYLLYDDGATLDPTTYVKHDAASERDSFGTANLGAGEVPKAVSVSATIGMGDGISNTEDAYLKISSTNYDNGDDKLILRDYRVFRWLWNSNPATATAWAEDDLDGAEFGVQRTT